MKKIPSFDEVRLKYLSESQLIEYRELTLKQQSKAPLTVDEANKLLGFSRFLIEMVANENKNRECAVFLLKDNQGLNEIKKTETENKLNQKSSTKPPSFFKKLCEKCCYTQKNI